MAMTKRYTTVNGQIMFAEQVSEPSKSFALVPDTLGNVIANKDVNGDMVRTCEYWPYGEIRSETDSNPTPFGYGGTWGYYSDPSGMLYVRARYYKPFEGRWLTVDPLWPGELAYLFVDDMPLTEIDYSGLGAKTCIDLLKGGSVSDKDRAKLAKCILDCIKKGGKPLRYGAECLSKLGKAFGKKQLLKYLCCLMYSERKEVVNGVTYYVDPCENRESENCCNARFCACLLDRPSGWESIADGMCPGKVVLKCQAAAEEECNVTGYVAPNI